MNIEHATVFADKDVYAGWPANHGRWQCGDELLFGFLAGPFVPKGSYGHRVKEPFARLLARSQDGGHTFVVSQTDGLFDVTEGDSLSKIEFDPTDNYRFCGFYDHGGDYCPGKGAVYASQDFGRNWSGPHAVPFLGDVGDVCSARTAVLDDLVFLTYRHPYQFGTDYVVVARMVAGSLVKAGEIRAIGRVAMPSVARIGDVIYAACRRREYHKSGFIQIFKSLNNGLTWELCSEFPEFITGSSNGNPPSLVATWDSRLALTYGNRTENIIVLAVGIGTDWRFESIRTGGVSDIGYPQSFINRSEELVVAYYWTEDKSPQRIERTIVSDY